MWYVLHREKYKLRKRIFFFSEHHIVVMGFYAQSKAEEENTFIEHILVHKKIIEFWMNRAWVWGIHGDKCLFMGKILCSLSLSVIKKESYTEHMEVVKSISIIFHFFVSLKTQCNSTINLAPAVTNIISNSVGYFILW